jgi:hypothetical protein
VQSKGVFLLLDELETADRELGGLYLATLLDLCRQSAAVSHIQHWRSPRQPSVGIHHLLIRLWRVEQTVVGVALAEDEILAGRCSVSLHLLTQQIHLCHSWDGMSSTMSICPGNVNLISRAAPSARFGVLHFD